MKKYLLFLPVAAAFFLSSCKKDAGGFTSLKISDYAPLETGKYITYHLDSIVYQNFGGTQVTNSYEVKYVVDSLLTDNTGRPAYRVFRFIRTGDPNPWVPSGTSWAIDTKGGFEFIENNLRFLKLLLPIENGTTWKGNEYIDTYSSNFELQYLDDWDYVYDAVGEPATIGNFNLENTLTVRQRDEVVGDSSDINSYSEVNFGEENYALGIGMVYRKFFHSEYQPGTGGGAGYIADGSYGVTMTMIDHN